MLQTIKYILFVGFAPYIAQSFRVQITGQSIHARMNIRMSLSTPPKTFIDCARLSATAARKALDDGENLIEVEFPPLPLKFLEDSTSSARDIADANTRWAIEFSKSFVDLGLVSIIYPDQPEVDDAIKYVDMPGGANPLPNVTLGTIRTDSIRNANSLDQILMSVFGATVAGTVEPIPGAPYHCLSATDFNYPLDDVQSSTQGQLYMWLWFLQHKN